MQVSSQFHLGLSPCCKRILVTVIGKTGHNTEESSNSDALCNSYSSCENRYPKKTTCIQTDQRSFPHPPNSPVLSSRNLQQQNHVKDILWKYSSTSSHHTCMDMLLQASKKVEDLTKTKAFLWLAWYQKRQVQAVSLPRSSGRREKVMQKNS